MRKAFISGCLVCCFLCLYGQETWTPPAWVDFLYPKVSFINKAEHTEGWKIYNRIVPNPEEFIRQHALWVAQTLYWSANDSMPEIRKINYSYEDRDGISAKGGNRSVIHIFYSSQWVEKTAEKYDDVQALYETRGVLYHELTHAYQLEPQGIGGYRAGTEFWVFIEGMADAVRYHNGFFPVSSRKPGGKWMDGYRTTGFFLEWLTCKDPDFLRKFNASTLTVIPWSFDKAMQSIFGEKVTTDSLWEEYQTFLRRSL
ncbi:MAG: basic secretory family protein [Prevotella sp.]|jgi:hypothetical protein|nr:basic secretory family protein [Prevotella sp.]